MNINSDFFRFIEENKESDPQKLRLKYYGSEQGFDMDLAITQIEAKRKFRNKFRNFLSSSFIIPSLIAGEQATHEDVAKFHASLVTNHGKILDMTAGLGIDALSMAMKGVDLTAIELDSEKASVLKYNSAQLGLSLKVIIGNSIKYLKETEENFDVIFIDPSRRDEKGSKVFLLSDCEPDILKILSLLKKKARRILIKVSPMLDISSILKVISGITSLRAISVKGECKEVLIDIDNENSEMQRAGDGILFEALNLDTDGNIIADFKFTSKNNSSLNLDSYLFPHNSFSLHINSYLYEPDASVMKFAPWRELIEKFPDLKKIAPSSHLFVSSVFYPDFPGRKLKINEILMKKEYKKAVGQHLNIVSRNFHLSADEIRKHYKIKEGDENFLFATTLSNKVGIMILCSKI